MKDRGGIFRIAAVRFLDKCFQILTLASEALNKEIIAPPFLSLKEGIVYFLLRKEIFFISLYAHPALESDGQAILALPFRGRKHIGVLFFFSCNNR